MPLLRLTILIWVLLSTPAGVLRAADGQIPDPLSLSQALAFGDQHPRVVLGSDADALPRRAPVYLDCHRLAYGHVSGDDRRSRPLDALLPPLAAQRLEIMERFLDVLLADLSYSRYNEAMAVAYIQYDRASVRRDLGQFSELRVVELETVYQDVLRKRAASEATQRLTRALLAQAMARPGTLPRDLVAPRFPAPPAELPPLEAVLAKVSQTPSARAGDHDQPSSETYERLLAMERRQQVLELLLRLQALEAVTRYAATESFMRDLRLDESRTLYEQEVTADLGFAMSQQTKARLREQQVAYCRALAWAELDALQGEPVWARADAETSP
jgi:hypothetical protein